MHATRKQSSGHKRSEMTLHVHPNSTVPLQYVGRSEYRANKMSWNLSCDSFASRKSATHQSQGCAGVAVKQYTSVQVIPTVALPCVVDGVLLKALLSEREVQALCDMLILTSSCPASAHLNCLRLCYSGCLLSDSISRAQRLKIP